MKSSTQPVLAHIRARTHDYCASCHVVNIIAPFIFRDGRSWSLPTPLWNSWHSCSFVAVCEVTVHNTVVNQYKFSFFLVVFLKKMHQNDRFRQAIQKEKWGSHCHEEETRGQVPQWKGGIACQPSFWNDIFWGRTKTRRSVGYSRNTPD